MSKNPKHKLGSIRRHTIVKKKKKYSDYTISVGNQLLLTAGTTLSLNLFNVVLNSIFND